MIRIRRGSEPQGLASVREQELARVRLIPSPTADQVGARYRPYAGDLRKAQLYERSLKIREKALGDEHPKVATALENYARLFRDTERTSEAEEMEARARTIRERHAARERERGSEV